MISHNFKGTLSSKSGFNNSSDIVNVYNPVDCDVEYVAYYPDLEEISTSMFVSSKLNEKDYYSVFFGGNYPVVDIKTTSEVLFDPSFKYYLPTR